MIYLVTGGAGHLGANVVRRLLDDGAQVRVLLRRHSNNAALDGLDVERVWGDLRDRASLAAAVRGVDRVYHCAARLTTTDGGEQDLFESNVLGTRNLLATARDAGVGRVVVTGSFSAVGHRRDGKPSDESVPFNPFDRAMPYEKSKAGVEHECLKAAVEGQDVVVATSCAILGPNDFKPSRMGRVLCDFANGKLRAYIPGGFEFVAARDMVAGHVLAMERGRAGQKYIFASQFLTVDEIMGIYERVTGRRRPRLRLPAPVMSAIAHVTQPILNMLRPSSPQRFTPGAVRILRMHRHADTSKARTELGFEPTSIEDAVREQYEFFCRLGWIETRKRAVA
jgi:3beta-hydroxysteroid-4beta-carboxylate 3-dehydrogenase (decarboxylating)